jgi:hypothetical protein
MKHAREDYNRIQDPLGKIPEDEPVFLLRASDLLAPDTVRHWADALAEAGGDDNLIQLALAHANAMDLWQAEHGFKLPDL